MKFNSNKAKAVTKADIQLLKIDIQELDKKTDENQKILINKLDNLEKTLDGFVGRVDDLTIENKFGADQIHELRKQAKNHEERITKLESPQAA